MFSFFRRRKDADAAARRIIDQGRFLGARTPREAVEILWARPLSQNEWERSATAVTVRKFLQSWMTRYVKGNPCFCPAIEPFLCQRDQ
jgi:hypothetical protein